MSKLKTPQPRAPSQKLPRTVSLPQTELVVVLPALTRRYVPGTGPPLAPITLLPQRDSTAYIIDQAVSVVSTAHDGRGIQKRLKYLVGWHDRPAARAMVDARNILSYVSPLALEEWEYRTSLEREQEHLQEAKAAQSKRTRGRLPGISRSHRFDTDEADTLPMAIDLVPDSGRRKISGPSLSTPSKRRLEDFEEFDTDVDIEAGMELDESPSSAIHRQLYGESMQLDVESQPVELNGGLGRHSPSSVRNLQNSSIQSPLDPGWRHDGNIVVPGSAPQLDKKDESPSYEFNVPQKKIDGGLQRLATMPSKASIYANVPIALESVNPQNLSASGSGSASPLAGISFTPAGYSKPIPSSAGKEQLPTPSKASRMSTAKKRQRLITPRVAQTNEEGGWDVEGLEGMKNHTINGKTIRYFKVRWVGDWPPDQNPTWEPEENIPPALVTKYLKKSRVSQKPQSATQRPRIKKYTSISEAFDDTEGNPDEADTITEADIDTDEILRVTDDPGTDSHKPMPQYQSDFDLALTRAYNALKPHEF
jgi:hypothetical protein